MNLGYFLLLVALATASQSSGSVNVNVCSYTAKRAYHSISDRFFDEEDYIARATKFRCCDGWTRAGGNREGNAPCFIPTCKVPCGNKESCYKPDKCLCVLGYRGCQSTTYNATNGKKRSPFDQFTRWAADIDVGSEENFDNNLFDRDAEQHSKRSTSQTCPVALPQNASPNCTIQRQTELATNRVIYKIRTTPNFNDSGRDLDVLLTPLWDIDPPTAFGVGASDPFEAPWLNQYFFILGTNGQLVQTYLSLGNNSVREFSSISDWRELFFFFYMFHVDQGNVPTNINDLIIDMWQDDRVFAEQQIAGLNPFPVKRVIGKPCPRGWTLIGENCYRMFRGYPYSNFNAAKHVCECHISHLADLSDSQEAAKVNKRYKFASVPVYVDGGNGTWPDGTPVVGASNQPSAFRRCLTAGFTQSGLKLRYSFCFWPLRKILCQKAANLYGVKISTLKSVLNSSFKWKKAIRSKLASNSPYYSNTFVDAVQDGRVYVSEFPELRGIRTSPDFEEIPNDGRTMMTLMSPIAIFVSNPDVNHGEFLPVAIQINSTQNSPVYTPDDGDNWTIAKILVQMSAFTTAELLEHLLHTHLVNDPLCVSGKRNIPITHPVGQLIRQHCRGTLTTNKVGELSLIPLGGRVDRILTVGFKGQNDVINNGFNTWSFNNHDPNYRLKKSGLLDKQALPFFPYRDDGLELYKAIGDFIRDYVNLYYVDDATVVADHEMQRWANEIALGATGTPDSGKGKLRDFPQSFTTKAQVIDVLHKFVWSSSCQHAAVNFPVIEYGTFLPNMPGKIYNVDGVTGFDPIKFPTKTQSLTHVEVGFNLASLHFDSLFDYAASMADSDAEELVFEFKARIDTIQANLVARNNANVANGHLSYKYLHPKNVPNSISS
ncbi:Allene oxide synthase-lipoxygenase protein [Trichoplax sp. H2]|nr:Allene oxide synthase-lipoxygenase protein [Trichoplax sp. H2]|eukprot:RDD39626.1 Allene oxide synthase-lipoxygenase protein [Trichoplax sp. H2]